MSAAPPVVSYVPAGQGTGFGVVEPAGQSGRLRVECAAKSQPSLFSNEYGASMQRVAWGTLLGLGLARLTVCWIASPAALVVRSAKRVAIAAGGARRASEAETSRELPHGAGLAVELAESAI